MLYTALSSLLPFLIIVAIGKFLLFSIVLTYFKSFGFASLPNKFWNTSFKNSVGVKPILELSEENFGVLIDYKYGNDEEVRDKFKVIKKHNLHYESRLFNTIPRNYVMRYQKAIKYFEKNTEQNFNMNDEQIEFNLRCHILVDYISGMTDDFALERYNLLSGHAIK